MSNKSKKTKSNIEVTEEQLQVMREALEYYSRHLSGQFEYLDPFRPVLLKKDGMTVFGNEETDKAIRILKKEIFDLSPHASYGIGGSCKESQMAYEMYREIYRHNHKKRPETWSVYNYPTLRYSGEPLIIIKEKQWMMDH